MSAGADASPVEIWQGLAVSTKLLFLSAFILSMGPIYYVLFEASSWQATFGKRLLNIYVTTDDRKRMSIGRACVRWAAKFVLSWFWFSFVSTITIAATEEHKAIHDYVAETIVLKGRLTSEVHLEPWRIMVAFGFPAVWVMGAFMLAYS
jgi:uncharacterized RDD family membrane protein YckC